MSPPVASSLASKFSLRNKKSFFIIKDKINIQIKKNNMTDIIKQNSQNSDCDSTQSGKMGPEMGYTEHVPSVICNF